VHLHVLQYLKLNKLFLLFDIKFPTSCFERQLQVILQTIYLSAVVVVVYCHLYVYSCGRDSAVKSSAAVVYTTAIGICSTEVIVTLHEFSSDTNNIIS